MNLQVDSYRTLEDTKAAHAVKPRNRKTPEPLPAQDPKPS